jgi:hypothetical protein
MERPPLQEGAPTRDAGSSVSAAPSHPAQAPRQIKASNWVRCAKNTLIGFVDLEVAGLTLHGCTVHQKGESRWIGLPGRQQLHRDGNILTTPKTCKPAYSATVSIGDLEARARFQRAALRAVDELLGEGGEP